MKVFSFCPKHDSDDWDKLVLGSNNGVFLHTRRFIAYHKEKFVDRSLVFRDENGKMMAVLPAAQDSLDASIIVSHPGLTYGGIIFEGRMECETVDQIVRLAVEEFRRCGASKLIYKCIPIHLQEKPARLDEYILWKIGATMARRDLWNVIALNGTRTLSKGRRWGVAKAHKAGLNAIRVSGYDSYAAFHHLLANCLDARHQVHPVHTCNEMCAIADLFPNAVELWTVAGPNTILLAGAWIFKMGKQAWHTQYIAATEEGRSCQAVDLLIEAVMESAENEGVRYFSFGASTEQHGRILNAGLFNFKAAFGFGAITHDTYSIELT